MTHHEKGSEHCKESEKGYNNLPQIRGQPSGAKLNCEAANSRPMVLSPRNFQTQLQSLPELDIRLRESD